MDIWDYAVLFGYLAILVVIGWRARHRQKDIDLYFVGGRKAGTFAVMTLWLTAWVGGATILGTAEQAYEIGIRALLYPLGMTVGCVLFALTFTGRIKEAGDAYGHITYPDFIERSYGPGCRIVSTVTALCANIGYAASQLLATAVILHELAGISMLLAFILATTVTVFYTAAGGFLALDRTCRFQAILILAGTGLIGMPLMVLYTGEGGSSLNALPASFTGLGDLDGISLLGMFISIILTFYTSSDSYVRCFSARSRNSAIMGTVLAGLLIMGIGISVCIMGLGARVLFPDLGDGSSAFITVILRLFPSGLKGLMLVVLLAAIMSTACSCILTASANVTRDIYQRFCSHHVPPRRLVTVGVLSSVGVGIASALIAWYVRDIIDLLFMAFTVNSASLFVPTLGAYFWKKASCRAAFWSISLSLLTVIAWYAGRMLQADGLVAAVDPVWPGLGVSAVLFIAISLMENNSRNAVSCRG